MSAHPVFAGTLRTFGGAAYENVQALHQYTSIRVPLVEVELRSHNPGDAETWRSGKLSPQLTQRAYEILVDRHSKEFDVIARQLAQGDIK